MGGFHMDELVHQIKQLAGQAQIEQRPWAYGHVSSFDPNTNTVRVLVPSMRDDQTGEPLHSGWLPLGSSLVGAGSGIQTFPSGGATSDNPTAGELAMVAINDRGTGVAAVLGLFYTNTQQAPHNAVGQKGQAGDILFRHNSGTIQWFHSNATVEITTALDGAVQVTVSGAGGITLTSQGSGSIGLVALGSGDIDLAQSGSGGINITSASPKGIVISSSSNVTVNTTGNLNVNAGEVIAFTAPNMILQGTLSVFGDIHATGTITP